MRALPTGRTAVVAAVVAHAVASVPYQALGRRVGLPYRTPRPGTAVVCLAATAAAATATSWFGLAVAGAVATGRADGLTAGAGRATAPLNAAAAGWLPVLGPLAAVAGEIGTAVRLARPGTGSPTRVAARTAAATTVLVLARVVTFRFLSRLLEVRTPPSPPPPAPATTLNLTPGHAADAQDSHPEAGGPDAGHPDGYVVYFDGVGRVIPRTTPVGRDFAAAISARLPRWSVVMSLMPNDVTQRPAWQRPLTGGIWRWLMRRSGDWLVARGVWEAVVALDARYRVRFGRDQTAAVLAHLAAADYQPGSGVPIVFVGLSAGTQTALLAASDVARALGAPLDVVSLGGFIDGSADLSAVRRVHTAISWGDPAEMAPVLLFPSRWTALGIGTWSRGLRGRSIVRHRYDWATHVGRTGYLGSAVISDGRTRLDQAADLVQRAARELHASAGRDGRARRARADRT